MSGGQQSKVKVSARSHSLRRLRGRILPGLFQLLLAPGAPRLLEAAHSNLCLSSFPGLLPGLCLGVLTLLRTLSFAFRPFPSHDDFISVLTFVASANTPLSNGRALRPWEDMNLGETPGNPLRPSAFASLKQRCQHLCVFTCFFLFPSLTPLAVTPNVCAQDSPLHFLKRSTKASTFSLESS